MKRWRAMGFTAALLVVLTLGLAGCGGGDAPGSIGGPAPVQSGESGGSDQGDGSGTTGGGAQDQQEGPVLSDFTAQDLDGNSLTREEVLGQNRLNMVNVWATWCGYCVKEIPSLQGLADEYADQGFGVVGLLTDGVDLKNFDPDQGQLDLLPDNIQKAKELMENGKATYQVILPDINLLYEVVAGVDSYPTTFFTDSEGRLVGGVYPGVRSEKFWRETIEELLAELPQE